MARAEEETGKPFGPSNWQYKSVSNKALRSEIAGRLGVINRNRLSKLNIEKKPKLPYSYKQFLSGTAFVLQSNHSVFNNLVRF